MNGGSLELDYTAAVSQLRDDGELRIGAGTVVVNGSSGYADTAGTIRMLADSTISRA